VRRVLVLLFSVVPCVFAQASDAVLQRYYQEGEAALAAGRYADAEQAYEKLRQLSPETAEVHAKLGVIYFQEKKFAEAVPALRQALKLKPTLPNTDTLLAMSLSELGRYSEALPGLEKGFRRSTDRALKRMAGLQLERAYTGLQRDSKAVEVALELNRLYPDDPEVLYHTGRLFGNFAYLSMRRLSQVSPSSVWRHQAAGEAFESQGDHDLAIAEYRKVLSIDPGRAGIHFRIGRALVARLQQTNSRPEDSVEVLKEFEEERKVDPTNANAAYEMAEIHRRSGQLEKAQQLFEAALKNYPDFEEAQVGLGRTLIVMGKPDGALPHFQKAIALDPEDDVPYYHLAQVYKALGKEAEQQRALVEFRRIRGQRSSQRETVLFSPRDVTRQEVDANAAP
jgi:tetratricopeptide (TPR) repeat protein